MSTAYNVHTTSYKDSIIVTREFAGRSKPWSYKVTKGSRTVHCAWCHMEFFETEELALAAGKKLIDNKPNSRVGNSYPYIP